MTLNLSRLTFDPSESSTIRIIGNPYELHRFVYESMSADGDPGRLLWRLEAGYGFRNPRPHLLVQSEHPVVPHIPSRWTNTDFVRIETKSSGVTLRQGAVYRFRARVNPVRCEPKRIGVRGKRMGIKEPGDQIEWFDKRLKNNGMSLRLMDHRREAWMEMNNPKRQSSGRLMFASAFFDGVLEIADAVSAENAVLRGIGPGKGFGFGMISLALV